MTAYLGWEVPRRLQKRQEELRRAANVAALTDRFYSYDYYIEIIAPVWECYCKWMAPKSADDSYRTYIAVTRFVDIGEQISGPSFVFDNHPFNNFISPRGHLDQFSKEDLHKQANEHMILTQWFWLWLNVQSDIKRKDLDPEAVYDKLSRFYGFYKDFTQQLWMVGILFDDALGFRHANTLDLTYLDQLMFREEDWEEYCMDWSKNRLAAIEMFPVLLKQYKDIMGEVENPSIIAKT